MTDRKTASTITDPELTQLYERVAKAEERTEFYEAAHARMRDQLEVTRVRVRALADQLDRESPWDSSAPEIADRIRAALDGAPSGPAATQATEPAPFIDRPFRSHQPKPETDQPKEQ